VNPERARELLTAELTELDERARFAAEGRADTVDGDREGALSQHPGDYGTDVADSMDPRPEALTCREHADTPVGA
jgi:hypothetical protein